MATLADALTFSRAIAQTDSNGLTDTNGIVYANEALLDAHRKMIAAGVDASQLQESYVTGSAGVGTYLYPTDMFFLKAIEVNYTDTGENNFKVAKQVDVSNISGDRSFSYLRANADQDEPEFDDRGDWFEVFPDSPTQIRIFYFKEPTEYTATSDTIAYPISLDHRVIGFRIAANYKRSLGLFDEAMALDTEYEKKMKDLISTLSRGTQQPIQATPIQIDGFEF
jgi:hypothetical protein